MLLKVTLLKVNVVKGVLLIYEHSCSRFEEMLFMSVQKKGDWEIRLVNRVRFIAARCLIVSQFPLEYKCIMLSLGHV